MKLFSSRILLLCFTVICAACDYDSMVGDHESAPQQRIVGDAEPCPHPAAVAADADLTSEELVPQAPLCWYPLNVKEDSLGKCSLSFAPFETLEKEAARLTKAYTPDGTYSGFSSSSVLPARGAVVCTEDAGPVVVWQAGTGTCETVPDVSTWDREVDGFRRGGMKVKDLIVTTERPTLKVCIYAPAP